MFLKICQNSQERTCARVSFLRTLQTVVKLDIVVVSLLLTCLKLYIKGAFSGLIQLLATESSLKMIKNTFYFILKALFVLKIFKFLS